MPADRRKKTKTPEAVPDAGDPDRKRVLNVLAQRRYRQKRKEKIAALEAQASELSLQQSSNPSDDGGVRIEPDHTSSSSSGYSPDNFDLIEDIIRQPEVDAFPDLNFGQDQVDLQLFPGLDLCSLSTPIPASPVSPASHPAQPHSSTFPLSPDGAQLGIPILTAMKAFASIATALNLMSHIWDPTYLHVLPTTSYMHLPQNLRPIHAQMTVPHHPLLDAIPWPSVREKLICILALPSALRPPAAQEEDATSQGQSKAVTRLIQDFDDFREGVRVHGNKAGWGKESELCGEAWEVGECFYQNWWWCLDEDVVTIANRKRRERGDRMLRLKS